MLSPDQKAAIVVYLMFGLSILYVPFEMFGPLQFKSLQIERGYDPQTVLGMTTGEFGFLVLFFCNLTVLYLLFKVIQAGRSGESMLMKKYKINIILSYILAFASSFIPMATWYFLLPPDGWARSSWFFMADCVAQGRFWWGLIMTVLGSFYGIQYVQKYHPERLQP